VCGDNTKRAPKNPELGKLRKFSAPYGLRYIKMEDYVCLMQRFSILKLQSLFCFDAGFMIFIIENRSHCIHKISDKIRYGHVRNTYGVLAVPWTGLNWLKSRSNGLLL
jgi:hypothetical protein